MLQLFADRAVAELHRNHELNAGAALHLLRQRAFDFLGKIFGLTAAECLRMQHDNVIARLNGLFEGRRPRRPAALLAGIPPNAKSAGFQLRRDVFRHVSVFKGMAEKHARRGVQPRFVEFVRGFGFVTLPQFRRKVKQIVLIQMQFIVAAPVKENRAAQFLRRARRGLL